MASLRKELAETDRQIAEVSASIEGQEQLLRDIKANLQSLRQQKDDLCSKKRNLISSVCVHLLLSVLLI